MCPKGTQCPEARKRVDVCNAIIYEQLTSATCTINMLIYDSIYYALRNNASCFAAFENGVSHRRKECYLNCVVSLCVTTNSVHNLPFISICYVNLCTNLLPLLLSPTSPWCTTHATTTLHSSINYLACSHARILYIHTCSRFRRMHIFRDTSAHRIHTCRGEQTAGIINSHRQRPTTTFGAQMWCEQYNVTQSYRD